MNTEIQIFTSDSFGAVRTTTGDNGKILFCGKDVAMALGYKKQQTLYRHIAKGSAKYRPLQTAVFR